MRLRFSVILVASLSLLPTGAHAQVVRLSWDNCDPQIANKNFTGPGTYKLVESIIGAADSVVGHDSNIVIGPNVQDAWRFDDNGCQSGRLILSSSALSKSCPAFKGTNPLEITQYSYDPNSGDASIRLSIVFDSFLPTSATRYTMWQLAFDHTYSSAGVDGDSTTCDNAGPPYGYTFAPTVSLLETTGASPESVACTDNSETVDELGERQDA
jgi:hypothetical protein